MEGRPPRNESAVLDEVLSRLSVNFIVDREVPGTGIAGDRMRIDAVLRPIEFNGWKNPSIALGIEAKDAAPQVGDFKNAAAWIAQCVDYSYAVWGPYGRIPVFTWPAISDHVHSGVDVIPHILGQFNVGELRDSDRYGLTFVMHQRHRIWSEARGVEQGKRWTLQPRIGSGRRVRGDD